MCVCVCVCVCVSRAFFCCPLRPFVFLVTHPRGHTTTHAARALLKVLRRVLRRCLVVVFEGKMGSKKGY